VTSAAQRAARDGIDLGSPSAYDFSSFQMSEPVGRAEERRVAIEADKRFPFASTANPPPSMSSVGGKAVKDGQEGRQHRNTTQHGTHNRLRLQPVRPLNGKAVKDGQEGRRCAETLKPKP
jgi:hypothetical protein